MQSEELHEHLEYHSIKWDFIFPKSPWRGKNQQRPKDHAVAEIKEKLTCLMMSLAESSRTLRQ